MVVTIQSSRCKIAVGDLDGDVVVTAGDLDGDGNAEVCKSEEVVHFEYKSCRIQSVDFDVQDGQHVEVTVVSCTGDMEIAIDESGVRAPSKFDLSGSVN